MSTSPIVVSDCSPIVVLVKIQQIEILPRLFGEVLMPPQVEAELLDRKRPAAVREFVDSRPSWLRIQAPLKVEPLPGLDKGERAAISLATELSTALLLIDEAKGRSVALARGLEFTGTIGILIRGAEKGLLDLADAFERIKKTDFWVSPGSWKGC